MVMMAQTGRVIDTGPGIGRALIFVLDIGVSAVRHERQMSVMGMQDMAVVLDVVDDVDRRGGRRKPSPHDAERREHDPQSESKGPSHACMLRVASATWQGVAGGGTAFELRSP